MQFLTDATGSVRYLAFLLKKINFAYKQNCDIDAIYSQAYYLYKTGFDCDMNKDELDRQKQYNRRFFCTTTELDMIQFYLRPATQEDLDTYATEVYYWQAGQILLFLQDCMPAIKFNQTTLGKALKFQGFERKIMRINGVAKYVYPVVLNETSVYVREELKRCKKRN